MHIETLQLSASDLPSLDAFYGRRLGLATRNLDGALTLAAGETDLTFREVPKFEGVYHYAFNNPENRITAAIDWLESCRVELIPGADGPIHHFQDWNALTSIPKHE